MEANKESPVAIRWCAVVGGIGTASCQIDLVIIQSTRMPQIMVAADVEDRTRPWGDIAGTFVEDWSFVLKSQKG